jgi:hypothetical protein
VLKRKVRIENRMETGRVPLKGGERGIELAYSNVLRQVKVLG